MSLLDLLSSNAYVISFSSINVVVVMANTALVLCIKMRTPITMRTYSIILLNGAVINVVSSLVSFFVVPKMINDRGIIHYQFEGAAKALGDRVCAVAEVLVEYSSLHFLLLLCLSFSFRFFILSRGLPSRSKVWLSCGLLLVFGLVSSSLLTFSFESPHSVSSNSSIPAGNPGVFPLATPYPTAFKLLVSLIVFPVSLVMRHNISKHLDRSQFCMSPQIQYLHRMLVVALTVQLILPLLMAVSFLGLFLQQLSLFDVEEILAVSFMMPFALMAISPILTIIFTEHYRKFAFCCFTSTRVYNAQQNNDPPSVISN